jgi:phage terminase small subunit
MNKRTKANNPINPLGNTISKTQKKKKTTAKSKKSILPLIAYTDKEKQSCINLDSEFKWTQNLNDGQRLFVFHYCNQNSLKKNATEAARLAGYSVKNAKIQAAKYLQMPEILSEIKNINNQLLKQLTKTNLESTVKAIIARKMARLNMNPHDFYHIEEKHTDNGYDYVDATLKTPDELTDEQKELIEDIEYVGQRSVPHYKLPSKVQTENELLKIYKDFKDNEETGNDFDIETTAEIIGEKLQLKTKVICANKETADMSELATIRAANKEEED